MKLEEATHFSCDGCGKIKLTKYANKAKVAYSIHNSDTQKGFYYRPFWVMLCTECFEGGVEKEESKDDRDNNSE